MGLVGFGGGFVVLEGLVFGGRSLLGGFGGGGVGVVRFRVGFGGVLWLWGVGGFCGDGRVVVVVFQGVGGGEVCGWGGGVWVFGVLGGELGFFFGGVLGC